MKRVCIEQFITSDQYYVQNNIFWYFVLLELFIKAALHTNTVGLELHCSNGGTIGIDPDTILHVRSAWRSPWLAMVIPSKGVGLAGHHDNSRHGCVIGCVHSKAAAWHNPADKDTPPH